MSKEERLNALKNQAEMLQKNLEDINASISELEQEEQESK
jgi:prefoldin subunit 5